MAIWLSINLKALYDTSCSMLCKHKHYNSNNIIQIKPACASLK